MPALANTHRAAIPRMLLWEFIRRRWWPILNAQLAVLGISAIVYSLILRAGPLDAQAGRTLHFVLLCIVFVASGAAALAATGVPERFYLLPLSNRILGAITLCPAMLCISGMYVLTASVINSVFGVGWPIWGPALFLGVALGAIQAVTQLAGTGRMLRLVVCCGVAFPLEMWLHARYGGGSFLMPQAMWTTVTFGELCSLTLLALMEFVVVAYGIARDRRGDLAVLAMISRLFRSPVWPGHDLRRAGRMNLPRFRGPAHALFWFEWRQKGLILPATFGIVAAFLVAGYSLDQFEKQEYELLHGCFGYGTVFTPIALVAGLVLGHFDLIRANPECGSFLATRPATNAAISTALLKMEAVSLFVTWGLWSAAMFGTSLLLYLKQGSEPVFDLWTNHGRFAVAVGTLGYLYGGLFVGIGLLVGWVPLALATCLVLTGRQGLLLLIVTAIIPFLLLGLFLAESSSEAGNIFQYHIWPYLVGIVAIVATATAFAAARSRCEIDTPTCCIALAGWIALCTLVDGGILMLGPLEPALLVLTTGLLALPLAPFAAAPLALSYNRHR